MLVFLKPSFNSSTLLSIFNAFPNDTKISALILLQRLKSSSILLSLLFFPKDSAIDWKDRVSIFVLFNYIFSISILFNIFKAFPNDKKPSSSILEQLFKLSSIFFSP